MATKFDTQESRIANETLSIATLDDRDVRALTEYHTVLSDLGRVKDAEGLYLVVSQSGKEYLVEAHDGSCKCPDSQYHNPAGGCKHSRRVEFAAGRRAISADMNRSAVDPGLGEHIEGPRYADD